MEAERQGGQSSYREGTGMPSLGTAISTQLLMLKQLCEREK